MTSLEDPTKIIAEPGGFLLAPMGEERIGDVSNVLFSNGWIADENGTVYIYYGPGLQPRAVKRTGAVQKNSRAKYRDYSTIIQQ